MPGSIEATADTGTGTPGTGTWLYPGGGWVTSCGGCESFFSSFGLFGVVGAEILFVGDVGVLVGLVEVGRGVDFALSIFVSSSYNKLFNNMLKVYSKYIESDISSRNVNKCET